MLKWDKRINEIAFLLNPAFCGRLIYHTILEYQKQAKRAFPFMLTYLILPIILHKKTREFINSKTQMHVWLQRYPYLLIGFAMRTKNLVQITNEVIEFLLHCKIISISDSGEINIDKILPSSKEKYAVDDELSDCINKSKHIARWFAKSGNTETIYIMWGVRP